MYPFLGWFPKGNPRKTTPAWGTLKKHKSRYPHLCCLRTCFFSGHANLGPGMRLQSQSDSLELFNSLSKHYLLVSDPPQKV